MKKLLIILILATATLASCTKEAPVRTAERHTVLNRISATQAQGAAIDTTNHQ